MKVSIVKFDWDTETPSVLCLTNIIELIIGGCDFRLSYDKQKVYFCYNTPKHPEPISAYITTKELQRVKQIIGGVI